jgi:DNA-directed RNA polymerase subunit M/transcription elongation factor TFIIS
MDDFADNIDVEWHYEDYRNERPGKIRKKTDKLCPDCEEDNLYITVYENESENITYSQEFYECFECGYKESKKNKANNHRDDIDLDELYRR